MLDSILTAANKYTAGVTQVEQRREGWLNKYIALKDRLTQIAGHLNTNATYKQCFYVDVLHAFNEEINGTSAAMPSVTFRSGKMSMLITFKNSLGEKKTYEEDGFYIRFTPTITGQVVALLTPHHSELDKNPPQIITLAIIDDPGQLTDDITDNIITRGIETAFYTSFTGVTDAHDQQKNNEEPEEFRKMPITHNPIGFKLHETTEKIK